MRVRFGYVAIAMRLDKVTSSSPVTYKKYSSIESERERLSLLKRVTQSNLIDLDIFPLLQVYFLCFFQELLLLHFLLL